MRRRLDKSANAAATAAAVWSATLPVVAALAVFL
jgi:hypothetical protein